MLIWFFQVPGRQRLKKHYRMQGEDNKVKKCKVTVGYIMFIKNCIWSWQKVRVVIKRLSLVIKRRKGEIKRHLLLGRKAMTKLVSVLKSRDITLPIKVHLAKAVFPVIMYGCESWTIKKAEHQKTDAFELWCWRRLLRVPWMAKRSNQSILKEINPEYSLQN